MQSIKPARMFGASTITTLKKLGLVLRVETNLLKVGPDEFCKPISNLQVGKTKQLLTALGEGKVELVRAVGDLRESGEEDDKGTAPVSVKMGKIPPDQGVPKKGGTQRSGPGGKNGRSAQKERPNSKGDSNQTSTKRMHMRPMSLTKRRRNPTSPSDDEGNSDNAADFVQPQKPTPRRTSAQD
ncbi:hypothetical protein KEM48_005635 [Puccinia striiformis f. sp. tritici PST-130]|uniref:Uncharacterized protein n=1 Tax=Puccinia striiformis f. sp. tritici PST-78 TaxID=1165861 RepID=A0A0L0V7W7_9BASI|nr:hypothetical protein KEM48_005635 [Puccinia striiformis f. sp. tritici PST-130]KNE95372.1 hypothetical protein PSTG_11225 [Puccinia striiformis f. sp. tritici PST-78]